LRNKDSLQRLDWARRSLAAGSFNSPGEFGFLISKTWYTFPAYGDNDNFNVLLRKCPLGNGYFTINRCPWKYFMRQQPGKNALLAGK
jgi:hypothetical protein